MWKSVLNFAFAGGCLLFVACSPSKFSASPPTLPSVGQVTANRDNPGGGITPTPTCVGANCPGTPTTIPTVCPTGTAGTPPNCVAVVIPPPRPTTPAPRPTCGTGRSGPNCVAPTVAPVAIPRPKRPTAKTCQKYSEKIENNDRAKGVNLIVAVDTSKSIEDNRNAVMKALTDVYVNGLAAKVPVTIAFITGHSKISKYSVPFNNQTENFFYGNQVIKITDNQSANLAESVIEDLLTDMAVDNSAGISDGGELLLYNMMEFITSADRLAWAKSVGAITEGYSLGFVYVADENDICRPTDGLPGHKRDGNIVASGTYAGMEAEEASYKIHCEGDVAPADYGAELAKVARGNLKAEMGVDYFFSSAFVYTGEHKIPGGENEKGHGYIEFTQTMNKEADIGLFDLAEISSGNRNSWARDKASELARLTNFAADLYPHIAIKESGRAISLKDVEIKTVKVNGSPVAASKVAKRGGKIYITHNVTDQATVEIEYCK